MSNFGSDMFPITAIYKNRTHEMPVYVSISILCPSVNPTMRQRITSLLCRVQSAMRVLISFTNPRHNPSTLAKMSMGFMKRMMEYCNTKSVIRTKRTTNASMSVRPPVTLPLQIWSRKRLMMTCR